ncbi:glycosyltransferase family 39 protein [Methanobacterium sp. CWC-01]|uniref:ArnT family glycosyltransferase n=1 Tax=Methanobacterium aridiramus TaxID=2584467 RepID=UPI002574F959|nr:glycosyltransferase family 39 protein [Methanobacterium sp. CWC-01]WJI10123.1 glycosyltransferase family 39 protein [Methanobacterium sp. CWC-01]
MGSSVKMSVTNVLKEKYWLFILVAIFIFSFILDMYVLTRYSFSYGIDGAFYDIQVRNVIQYGFPMSNDPPLAYYLLTPWVILTGNSFLGIKIGMALMGSFLAFPAYLLTEFYARGKNVGSRVPALLSAFLVTVNINYFAMIGDYLQNLVGVLFLAVFLYFAIRWFENISQWKKFGVLTVLFLILNLLTHIYTGALAVLLFFALLIFNIVVKKIKTGKLPIFDLKILIILSIGILGCFIVLFLVYPVMYTKFSTVISFFNSSSSTTEGRTVTSPFTAMIFCSLPYLVGVLAAIIILYRGLKEKITTPNLMNRNSLLAWLYLALAGVLAVLSFIPSSQYQSRFLLMAFLPIALLVPLGLKFLETESLARYPGRKHIISLLVIMVAVIFAFSSYHTASEGFDNMGPTITTAQYNELVQIKQNLTVENAVFVAADFQSKYWVEYVLGGNVTTSSSIDEVKTEYPNSTIYVVTLTSTNQLTTNQSSGGFQQPNGNYEASFLLPYGPPILPNSLDKIPTGNSEQKQPDSRNGTNQPPGNMAGSGNNTGTLPGSMSLNGTPPSLSQGNNSGLTGANGQTPPGGRTSSQGLSLNVSGTTVFSGAYFKIVRYENEA